MDRAADRVRENLTGVVSVLVTGIWLVALVAGQDWWLPFLLLGYIVIVPMTALLVGDREAIEDWWDDEDISLPEEDEEQDAIETLKHRYAAGELDDEEFERKLEGLLEADADGRAPSEPDEIDRELAHERTDQ
jgi:uncharacterized membrane protein